MSSKTTNEDKEIATIASLHKAITTPAATCAYTDGKVYTNYITTNECAPEEAAERTNLRNFKIITVLSRIGVPYKGQPSHYVDSTGPFLSPGVTSHKPGYTYAKVVKGSRSLNVEGQWVARTDDPTFQAYQNSNGVLRENGWGLKEPDLSELLKQQCSIEVVKTKCDHEREIELDKVSRLEVFYGDKVTLTATRINATTTDPALRKIPVCMLESGHQKKDPANESHTRWNISRGAYLANFCHPNVVTKREESQYGDTLVLDKSWFDALLLGGAEKTNDSASAKQDKLKPEASDAEKKEAKDKRQVLQSGVNAVSTLGDIISFITEPAIEVKVVAIACAGPRTITIAAYPTHKISIKVLELVELVRKFEVIKDTIKKIDTWIRPIRTRLPGFSWTVIWLGNSTDLAAEKPESERGGPECFINVNIQYKELKHDARGRKKWEVHPAIELEFGCEKLLGFGVHADVPLFAAASLFGSFVQLIIDKLGGEKDDGTDKTVSKPGLYFTFGIALSIGAKGSISVDEYLTPTGKPEVAFDITNTFTVGLLINVGFGTVTGEVKGEFKPTVTGKLSDEGDIVYELTASIKLDFEARVEADCLGFKVGKTFGPYNIYTAELNPKPVEHLLVRLSKKAGGEKEEAKPEEKKEEAPAEDNSASYAFGA